MKKSFFIGIDPGTKGCAVCLNDEGDIEFLFDYPGEQIACFKELSDRLSRYDESVQFYAALEKVHGRPPMGAKPSFNFGANWATWRMVLVFMQIPFEEPIPTIWQKGMFKKSDEIDGKKKLRSLTVARRMWPKHYDDFKNKSHHNRSDASLIAYWLWKNR
jgi:hypothetical protein